MKFLFHHVKTICISALVPPLIYVGLVQAYLPSQSQPTAAVLSETIVASPTHLFSMTPTQTITPSVGGSPTNAPAISPTKKPTLTPTLMQMPTVIHLPSTMPTPTALPVIAAVTSEQLDSWFTKYSQEYGIDRQMLWNIAVCESGLNPNAKNGDYGGLYQFASSTWVSTRKHMSLDDNPDIRYQPEEAIKTAAFKISKNGTSAWANCD